LTGTVDCIRGSGVKVAGAELHDGGEDLGVLLHTGVAVLPHCPKVWTGGGGGDEGEEAEEGEEEEVEAAAHHVCG